MSIFYKIGKKLSESSLGSQLSLLLIAGFVLLVLMIFTAMTLVASNMITKQSIWEAKRLTEVFAQQSALALLYRSQDNANSAVNMALSFPNVKQVAIYDEKFNLLYEKHQTEHIWQWQNSSQVDDNVVQLEFSDKNRWQFIAPVFDRNSSVEETPFDVATEINLIGYVRLLKSRKGQRSLLNHIIAANIIVSLIIAALLLLALQWLNRRITAPLSILVDTMSKANERQTNLRVSLEGAKELREIGASFNEMMSILKAHQEQLREYARLKEEFTASVSHEIRTPLTGIVGVLELLQDDNMTKEDRKRLLQIASDSSNTLNIVINDILDFSKISAGKLKLERISLNLQKLFSDILVLHCSSAEAKQLKLSYDYESNVPVYVLGDSVRIQQVLNNLISNAIKFTEQGEVLVRVSLIKEEKELSWLRIEVSDTGIGIEKDKLGQIFESYSQGAESTVRKYGGTGLGLTITKQLVELMSGKISVTSEVSKGSCFVVELPFGKSYSAIDLEEEMSLQAISEKFSSIEDKILLVEDNIINQEVISTLLQKIGFIIDIVGDGKPAVEAVKKNNYSLVFMDCQLPEMDGLEATKQIRQLGKEDLPIVALTANAEQADIERYKESGMDDILFKPFNRQKLVEILTKWLLK